MAPKIKPFDEKYIPEPNSGCWLWTSGIGANGYGRSTANALAHRQSYELHVGPIPAGMCVCHKCDTRSCVNPDHLFIGTTQENTADRDRKGRAASGEKRGAHLTEQQVLEVLRSDATAAELASHFGVARSVIYAVRERRTWKRIAAQAGVFIPDAQAA